jgi:hypothetical protein
MKRNSIVEDFKFVLNTLIRRVIKQVSMLPCQKIAVESVGIGYFEVSKTFTLAYSSAQTKQREQQH